MEVASLQHLGGDSFSHGWLNRAPAPSFERRLADAGIGYSLGSSRSFIDMDPSELFSMRWTATGTPTTDFEFVLPESGEVTSPVLVSASQIFRSGRLLPCEPVDGDESAAGRLLDMPSAARSWPTSPMFYSAQSTPFSSARSDKHVGSRSPWKVLLRFLMPLYRKARALRPVNRVSPASPGRGSTSSSMEWCHGNADTAVDDAILYCKKSRGKEELT